MREKYENLLNEIEEISRDSYALAEVLQGYCDYQEGEKVSSSLLGDFFKKIVLGAFGISVVLLMVSALFFKVDDMTLSKGVVYDFNGGWELVRNTKETEFIEELPYLGESAPNERIIAHNLLKVNGSNDKEGVLFLTLLLVVLEFLY